MIDRKCFVATKSIKMRETSDPESPVIATLPFKKELRMKAGVLPEHGRVLVYYQKVTHPGKDDRVVVTITGWIPVKGITLDKPIEMARLNYWTRSDRPTQVYSRIDGKETITLKPLTPVEMIARVGDWGLSDYGWVKMADVRKDRTIYSAANAKLLLYSYVKQAVLDYTNAVTRMKRHKCSGAEDFKACYDRVMEVRQWFASVRVKGVPGKEVLEGIDASNGVTEKWLKDQERIYREIRYGK
jgi:hypothetical protein